MLLVVHVETPTHEKRGPDARVRLAGRDAVSLTNSKLTEDRLRAGDAWAVKVPCRRFDSCPIF